MKILPYIFRYFSDGEFLWLQIYPHIIVSFCAATEDSFLKNKQSKKSSTLNLQWVNAYLAFVVTSVENELSKSFKRDSWKD